MNPFSLRINAGESAVIDGINDATKDRKILSLPMLKAMAERTVGNPANSN